MKSVHDNTYALWLYADKKLKINSFYIKANKSGYITLGLYNDKNKLLSSKQIYTTKDKEIKVNLSNFLIPKRGNYYLAIEKSNGISLSYHTVKNNEYKDYQRETLQVMGVSKKGESSRNQSFYQYFYDINYTILE